MGDVEGDHTFVVDIGCKIWWICDVEIFMVVEGKGETEILVLPSEKVVLPIMVLAKL